MAYNPNPYERREDPRCLSCDVIMIEVTRPLARWYECQNLDCEECAEHVRRAAALEAAQIEE